MTKIELLEELKSFTETALKDLLQPYQREKRISRNQETDEPTDEIQPVRVYLHRLPDEKALRTAPCVLHQLVTGKDFLNVKANRFCSVAVVRTGFCAYDNENGAAGGTLLNLMERLRIALLKEPRLANGRFLLDLESGVETLVYPDADQTKPFALGEMIATWYIPTVRRELSYLI